MYRLSFLSKVAFICNICFLLTFVMQFYLIAPKGQIESTIIVAGFGLSFIMNGLVNVLNVFALFKYGWPIKEVPIWLTLINFLFLIPQLYLIIR